MQIKLSWLYFQENSNNVSKNKNKGPVEGIVITELKIYSM
jgi:hypothetical protein